jgi:hypothetical protein
MYDEKKVARVNELVQTIKQAEAELESIFGGTAPKKTWSRRPKSDEPKTETNPGL